MVRTTQKCKRMSCTNEMKRVSAVGIQRSSSFLDTMGGMGDLVDVTVIHPSVDGAEQRFRVRALIQASTGFFEVDTRIYDGNSVEIPDPRGGTEIRYVAKVKVNKAPGNLSHIAAKWGSPPRRREAQPASVTYNGPVVHVQGDHAQLAWGNTNSTQNQTKTDQIAPGYEAVAVAVADLVKNLDTLQLDRDDAMVAREAAEAILGEVTNEAPDRGRLVRSMSALRGVVAQVAMSAGTGVSEGVREFARTAVEQLASGVLPPV